MSLQPVSGVTPLHTSQVNFGRRHYDESIGDNTPRRIPAAVKAVPIAVLIAMSPLNEVNAVGAVLPEPEVTEVVSSTVSGKPKVIGTYEILDKNGNKHYEVKKLNLDANSSTYEALEVLKYEPVYGEVYSRGIVTSGFVGRGKSGKAMVTMEGIPLSKDNLNSYEAGVGLFKELKLSDYNNGAIVEIAKFLREIAKDEANNEAFVLYTEPDVERTAKNSELKKVLK